jgi:HSP20 family protein
MMGSVSNAMNQGIADLTDDARNLLSEIDNGVPGAGVLTAECRPLIDVIETATSIEVLVDVPGVPAEALRVVIRRETLLVVGAKLMSPPEPQSRFHLAERSYGRFARAIRLTGAFDGSRARATVSAGQLRVVVPRLEDRRGALISVPVVAQ